METEHSIPENEGEREDVCTSVRMLFCGCDRSVAPCTYCEWCGICPQHYLEKEAPDGK